jgi:GNAT superfamily N-acetyltransferase
MIPLLLTAIGAYLIGDSQRASQTFAEGGEVKLLAPNGKPSNLTPEQYRLVREPSFKAWFGDWENDAANASKVVDENGEPLVVYHGSKSAFTVFNNQKSGQSSTAAKVGFWFTPQKSFAENFAGDIWYGEEENPITYDVFLSLKNPKIYISDDDNSKKIAIIGKSIKEIENQIKEIRLKWRGDFQNTQILGLSERKMINESNIDYYSNKTKEGKEAIKDGADIFVLNQDLNELNESYYSLIYSDSYEKFKSDIYKMEGKSPYDANIGGLGMSLNDSKATIQKYVDLLKSENHDGIVILQTEYDKRNAGGLNDQYVAFESAQIKLADGTNTAFDGSNPDIRYQEGGEVQKLINEGIVELKFHETTPEHAKEYGIKAANPIYVETLFVSENSRLKGIGKQVLLYLEDYAKKNGNDVIFGHINNKAKFTRDNRATTFCDVDIIRYWLHDNGYAVNDDNNDFHKLLT